MDADSKESGSYLLSAPTLVLREKDNLEEIWYRDNWLEDMIFF